MVDGPELGSPSADEVNLLIEAAPINPAEILIIEGKYVSNPPTCQAWHRGSRNHHGCWDGVQDFAVGDRVISMGRANWAQRDSSTSIHFDQGIN